MGCTKQPRYGRIETRLYYALVRLKMGIAGRGLERISSVELRKYVHLFSSGIDVISTQGAFFVCKNCRNMTFLLLPLRYFPVILRKYDSYYCLSSTKLLSIFITRFKGLFPLLESHKLTLVPEFGWYHLFKVFISHGALLYEKAAMGR
jgi:hypothetical protein